MSSQNFRIKLNNLKKFRLKNFIAVLENPKNLENVGSTLRNLDAFGVEKLYVVDGLRILPDSWDKMRKSRRLMGVSASAVKWKYVKIFQDTRSCIEHLNKNGFKSVVTSPHIKGKSNYSLNDANFTCRRLAVWFGNEVSGISQLAVDNAKFCVSIPMFGVVESLNLGTSTGVVLYEAARQRRSKNAKKRNFKANSIEPSEVKAA